MAGLVGSATHCAGMCGPFVVGQVAARLNPVAANEATFLRRLQGAALLPYHLGRTTTYCLLGVLAALFAAEFKNAVWFHDVAAFLLAVAGVLFLVTAVRGVPGGLIPIPDMGRVFKFGRVARFVDALFAMPTGWRGYGLGIILGFLPCGLVYAALLAVAARADVVSASLGMGMFALGTVPALIAIGLGGRYMLNRFRPYARIAFPAVMVLNSFILFAMAGGLI